MYLLQFRIKIFHRNKKLNIIFNVFFRLFIVRNKLKNYTIDNLNIDKFNTNIVDKLIDILIQITNEFRKKLIFNMFIKLQQKTTKKISQFTIANSQQSIIISDLTSYIITNVYIEIIIFNKNEKSSSRKRERLSKKHSFVFFHKINDVISKKFKRFSKHKAFVTIIFKLSIVKNF